MLKLGGSCPRGWFHQSTRQLAFFFLGFHAKKACKPVQDGYRAAVHRTCCWLSSRSWTVFNCLLALWWPRGSGPTLCARCFCRHASSQNLHVGILRHQNSQEVDRFMQALPLCCIQVSFEHPPLFHPLRMNLFLGAWECLVRWGFLGFIENLHHIESLHRIFTENLSRESS